MAAMILVSMLAITAFAAPAKDYTEVKLVVIDTEDAVLVCSADRVQDVKQIIEELERRGWKEHL